MSRGPRQQQHGSSSSATQQSQQNVRRGNKTLGWYLGGLMPAEKGTDTTEETEEHRTSNQQMLARKTSLAEESRASPKSVNRMEDQQRRVHHARYRHNHHSAVRPRANSSASASKKPHPNSQNFSSGPSKEQQQQIEFHKSGGKAANGKENYWYYDPVSDGYYYEHNGTRGWRKRNAKLDMAVQAAQMKGIEEAAQKLEQQKLATIEANKQQQQQQQNAPPSLLAAQQLAKLTPNAACNNASNVPFGSPMAIKYFDNDGYFYEMASVDGWRRRQPGTGTTPPNSLASSFGAQQKAPSPVPSGQQQQMPRRKPLQYQAYQQPPPQLTSLDMQEMLMMAKQQQNNRANNGFNTTATGCCSQPQCCAQPAPTCFCTIAAMAAQLVLQKQQQMMTMKSGGTGAEMSENSDFNAKPGVRPLLEGLAISNKQSDKFNFDQHMNRTKNNNFMHSHQPSTDNSNWQFPRNDVSKWNSLGIASAKGGCTEEKTMTAQTVGSFEEPYEFYSSGDEASSEAMTILPNAQLQGGGKNNITSTTTAASVSSIDDDGLEELMFESSGLEKKRQLSIAPIGSEAMALGLGVKKAEEKHGKLHKRPESLRLTCPKAGATAAYEPISPGEILLKGESGAKGFGGKENAEENTADMVYLPAHANFDVDKFIANLPPMPSNNHESILHQMRNPLRTPIGPPISTEPSTADSPLFTPIFLGRNPWTYRTQENPWAYP